MEIRGFKAFNHHLLTRYGVKLEVGMTYYTDKQIKYGNNGNGFHFCKNLADTLRFFDGMNEKVDICEVIGSEEIIEREDDYNGYYEMYVCKKLHIIKELSRDEILKIVLGNSEEQIIKLIKGYKLSPKECETILRTRNNNINISDTIDYFQFKKLDTYQKKI